MHQRLSGKAMMGGGKKECGQGKNMLSSSTGLQTFHVPSCKLTTPPPSTQ